MKRRMLYSRCGPALALSAVATMAALAGPEGRAMAQANSPAAQQDMSGRAAGLEALPFPPGYREVGAGEVAIDGGKARLVRYERADGRNSGLGGEHFSTVTDPSGKLKGFTRMDLSLREGELPGEEEAQSIAMRFLGTHAPDLLPGLRISFIAPHEETVESDGRPVTLTGMKVKMRNTADGRWFWVIVGSDREVMVFERDIVWANLQGRRQTEMWLHDRWLEERGADFLREA